MLWVPPNFACAAPGLRPRLRGGRREPRSWPKAGAARARQPGGGGRAGSKREAIKMPCRRPERKTRPPQISWACGIILIKIIDSYCTCENGKKIDSNPQPHKSLGAIGWSTTRLWFGKWFSTGLPQLGLPVLFYLLFTSSLPRRGLGGSPYGAYRAQRDLVSDSQSEVRGFP